MATVSLPPFDELYSLQWYLRTMKVPEAWQLLHDFDPALTYGDPNIIVSIFDQGLGSVTIDGELVCSNTDLRAPVSNGLPKVHRFYDFANDVPNNNSVLNAEGEIRYHGIYAAGVAAANVGGKAKSGMTGVAANCRLMGMKRTEDPSDSKMAKSLLRMAGFVSIREQWKYHPQNACDIINCSFNWYYSHGVPTATVEAATLLKEQGRGGKGTIIIAAAGNNAQGITASSQLPQYAPQTIIVGASTINSAGEEVPAAYSNYSDGYAFVDICAPSSLVVDESLENNPLSNKGIITTTYEGAGNTGSSHNHINYFGGSSAAAPLVAGVVALMLSANPALTAAEVKQILRDTADIIDRNNTDEIAKWHEQRPSGPNQRPELYSKKMGRGRVNAEAAVRQALALR